MPENSTTNSWLFPPETREAQFDEKWSFVGKKEKHCDPSEPEDARQGDNWDHVAFDPEHRLVVSVVPGKRTEEKAHQLVQDFEERTAARLMNLTERDLRPRLSRGVDLYRNRNQREPDLPLPICPCCHALRLLSELNAVRRARVPSQRSPRRVVPEFPTRSGPTPSFRGCAWRPRSGSVAARPG